MQNRAIIIVDAYARQIIETRIEELKESENKYQGVVNQGFTGSIFSESEMARAKNLLPIVRNTLMLNQSLLSDGIDVGQLNKMVH
jgi:hypothetical protein